MKANFLFSLLCATIGAVGCAELASAKTPKLDPYIETRACYKAIRELSGGFTNISQSETGWSHLLLQNGVDNSGIETGESIDYKLELGRKDTSRILIATGSKYFEIPFNPYDFAQGSHGILIKLPNGKSVILDVDVYHHVHKNDDNDVMQENAFFNPGSTLSLSGQYERTVDTKKIQSSFDLGTSDFTNAVRKVINEIPNKFSEGMKYIRDSDFVASGDNGFVHLKDRFNDAMKHCKAANIVDSKGTNIVDSIQTRVDDQYNAYVDEYNKKPGITKVQKITTTQ